MGSIINNFDMSILNFIRDNLTNPFMDKFMTFITYLGDKGLIWIIIGIILLVQKKYRKVGLVLLLGLLLNAILGEVIIKNIVQRPRVFNTYPDIHLIIKGPSSYSFPSGHTASSFVAAGILSYYIKDIKYIIYAFASLVAFSRLYLYVHYPTDIIGGIILGTVSAMIVIQLTKIFEKKSLNN